MSADSLPTAARPAIEAGAPDGAGPLLVARGLRVVLGGRTVLDGLDLTVGNGSVHALMSMAPAMVQAPASTKRRPK